MVGESVVTIGGSRRARRHARQVEQVRTSRRLTGPNAVRAGIEQRELSHTVWLDALIMFQKEAVRHDCAVG